MTWGDPWFLFGLLILPLIGWYYWRQQKKPVPTVLYSRAASFKKLMTWRRKIIRHIPFVLRFVGVGLLVIALARPRISLDEEKVKAEGIDIVIALDISTSMLAEDLEPKNRLEAAKKVAKEFISKRVNDRVGLVMFAGESFTWCPLTLDYTVLANLMDKVQAGTVKDGTGIGKAIATGVNRLRSSEAKSKVLILLTDGVNNVDQPDPLTAARAGSELGVKIYTIGVGTQGVTKAPVNTAFGVQYQQVQAEIDEELLKQIAKLTGGLYFRATSTNALRNIYDRIDELETTEIEVEYIRRYRELFYKWAAIALVLLVVERVLTLTWIRNVAV